MKPRVAPCPVCRERTPLRRFWRAGTVRWHDLLDDGGMHRCPGAGRYPLWMVGQ